MVSGRSDNGPWSVAQLIRQWLQDLGVQTALIEPGILGRMDTLNHKMESSETNYLTERSLIR
jgi:hypothetical protein